MVSNSILQSHFSVMIWLMDIVKAIDIKKPRISEDVKHQNPRPFILLPTVAWRGLQPDLVVKVVVNNSVTFSIE